MLLVVAEGFVQLAVDDIYEVLLRVNPAIGGKHFSARAWT